MSRARLPTGIAAAFALAVAVGVAGRAAAAPPFAEPPAGPGAQAYRVVEDGGGLLVSWIEPIDAGAPRGARALRIAFARFAEAGGWSAPRTIVEREELFANWADTPGILRGGDGALYAWWLAKLAGETYAYGVALARSEDDGASWKRLGFAHDDGPIAAEHGFVSAIADPAGVRLVWLDGRATSEHRPMELRSALATAAGPSASELIDDAVCDCCTTDLVATAAGPIAIYRDRSAGEIRDIAVARRDASGRWTKPRRVAADDWKIAGCPVNGPTVAALGGSRLAAAWYSAAGDRARVAVAFSNDLGAAFGRPIEVDSAAPIGRVDVAPAGADAVWISWLARIAGDDEHAALRLARVDPRGGVTAAREIVRTGAGRTSGVPRLAALGDALVAAWLDTALSPAKLRLTEVERGAR